MNGKTSYFRNCKQTERRGIIMGCRTLTESEITDLKSNRCTAENWDHIEVKEDFTPEFVTDVHFSGDIRLGSLSGTIADSGTYSSHPTLHQCTLHNCTLGDNVRITNVGLLANYRVGEQAVIKDAGTISVNGETQFGNGTVLEVVNEGGGRELTMYDSLSAQIAYLQVFYRHNRALVSRLTSLIGAYAERKSAEMGEIGPHARIAGVREIIDVHLDPYATVSGAISLKNGTIRSESAAPAHVGAGVIAEDFIILQGSHVTEGAILTSCFVGQGVRIGKGFSGEHSVFFANSEAFHSEGVALFAGPYTVTHHKSTLLIAGLYSFFNAGSGTNQSNHMYKLGPVHQGIVERGAKTGSFSYLLWPSRIGAYSVVIGKHFSNLDLTDFPFSYIDEEEGKSVVTPGMNLFTTGTLRDSQKWPNRDRRETTTPLDLINFELFNPYIIGRILRGIGHLQKMYEETGKDQDFVTYNGATIKRLMLKMGLKYYRMAARIYFGDWVVRTLESLRNDTNISAIRKSLHIEDPPTAEWIDLAGMIANPVKIDDLIVAITGEEIDSIQEVQDRLKKIYHQYTDDERRWALARAAEFYEVDFGEIAPDQLTEIVEDWQTNRRKFHNMILKDAEKEFAKSARIGYGIDNPENTAGDFDAVRGSAGENSFVGWLKEESVRTDERAETLVERLKDKG